MRLIGIGLLAFLLAGLALLLARSEMVGQTWRAVQTLTYGPQLRFEVPMAAEAHAGDHRAIIHRAGPATPLILSGLPAYQGAVFHMPIDARPTSGYLQIDATSQVLDGVEGVLRISVDNTRRAEVLLHPGEAVRSVRIELTSADIAQAQLVVSFSLQGTGANPVCAAEAAVEAVVEIETTSALFVALDAPLETARDRVAVWGDQTRLIWDGTARALVLATQATRTGDTVLFVPDHGLSLEEAEDMVTTRQASHRASATSEFAWSDAMSETGGLFGLRRFQRSHTWRLRYDLAQALSANLPEALALSLALPAHPMGADWQVTLTQNDRLLAHITVPAAQTQLNEHIPLLQPAGLAHTIEITVTSAFQPEGTCNDGPDLLAEILPGTQIIPSTTLATDPIRALRAALEARSFVAVTASGALNTAEANVAVDLLHALVPGSALVASDSDPAIAVLPRGTALADTPEDGLWVLYRDAEDILSVAPAQTFAGREVPAVALLVHAPEAGA